MKKIIYLVFTILIIVGILSYPREKTNKIRVAEVTHSVFYTPFYVALENGYFKEEGLNIELILTPGADKVTAAVLSNDVEIGFCGTEATIYVYNNKEKDYLVNFAGLTKKDGSFLVSRKKYENFKLSDLKGKKVIGGRSGDCLKEYCYINNISIYDIYIDNGYTGTNYNRPEFNRLIRDIEKNYVDTVITKDFSRLGRDYIETGKYIEKYFPENNIRYISILDNYDSNSNIDDYIPFKFIINEM